MGNIGAFTTFDQINKIPASIVLLLTQSGTAAPTATVLKGTLSPQIADTVVTPAYGYTGVGTYTVTIAGAFPSGKTVGGSGIIDGATGSRYKVVRTSDNVATITTYIADGTLTNGLLTAAPIEIKVF